MEVYITTVCHIILILQPYSPNTIMAILETTKASAIAPNAEDTLEEAE